MYNYAARFTKCEKWNRIKILIYIVCEIRDSKLWNTHWHKIKADMILNKEYTTNKKSV